MIFVSAKYKSISEIAGGKDTGIKRMVNGDKNMEGYDD